MGAGTRRAVTPTTPGRRNSLIVLYVRSVVQHIQIIDMDTADFRLLFDGEPVPQLHGQVLAGGVTVHPQAKHTIVTLEVLCETASVEQTRPPVSATGAGQ